MPHPPRLMVGRDFGGGLTPAAYPMAGAFVLYVGYLLHIHTCSTDLTKETAPVYRRDLHNCPVQIPYYTPPSINLGGQGTTVIVTLAYIRIIDKGIKE